MFSIYEAFLDEEYFQELEDASKEELIQMYRDFVSLSNDVSVSNVSVARKQGFLTCSIIVIIAIFLVNILS